MLTREDIARLLPHGGDMILIDRVESVDADGIVCATASHRRPENPLRRDGRLPASSAVEYGAQAIALHAALNEDGRMRSGRLAALRGVEMKVGRLDDIDGDLVVTANRHLASGDRSIYDFVVSGNGRVIVTGRATVVLV